MDPTINVSCQVRRSVRDAFAAKARAHGLKLAAALRYLMENEVNAASAVLPTGGSAHKLNLRLRDAVRGRLREEAAARGSTPSAYAVALLEAQLLGKPGWTSEQRSELQAMRVLLADLRDKAADADAAARIAATLPLLDAAIAGNLAYWGATAPAAAPASEARARAGQAQATPAAAAPASRAAASARR